MSFLLSVWRIMWFGDGIPSSMSNLLNQKVPKLADDINWYSSLVKDFGSLSYFLYFHKINKEQKKNQPIMECMVSKQPTWSVYIKVLSIRKDLEEKNIPLPYVLLRYLIIQWSIVKCNQWGSKTN